MSIQYICVDKWIINKVFLSTCTAQQNNVLLMRSNAMGIVELKTTQPLKRNASACESLQLAEQYSYHILPFPTMMK